MTASSPDPGPNSTRRNRSEGRLLAVLAVCSTMRCSVITTRPGRVVTRVPLSWVCSTAVSRSRGP
eukprot:2621172-Prymnesium_polylepis.1